MRDAIDAFDRLVATAADSGPADAVERAGTVAKRVRSRRGYAGSTVVVALAGGTGSGKSSMINALAGEDVANSGALRPTTSEPQAWIPANPEPGLVRLLDDIGIEKRVGQDRFDWLAVIDLPDTDSVQVEHRQTVARLLPEVDLVVWVLDPEKYQDRVLHRDHIRPLAPHGDQFLFVLNQVDRLEGHEVPDLVDDLRSTLAGDGLESPVIIPTAADPDVGPPVGVEDLVDALRAMGDAKAVVHRKLVTDLHEAARVLAAAAGVEGGGGTGFAAEWDALVVDVAGRVTDDVIGRPVLDRAARTGRSSHRAAMSLFRRRVETAEVALSRRPDSGPGALAAVRTLDDYVADLAARVEGETAIEVRSVGGRIDEAVGAAVDTVAFGESVAIPPPAGWTGAVAWLRRMALLVAIVGALWIFDVLRSGDRILVPAVVTLAALLAVVVPAAVGAAAGAREATQTVGDQRQAIERAVAREIDRRLGRPLRDVLRKRAGVAAALAEFELVMAELDVAPGGEPSTRKRRR